MTETATLYAGRFLSLRLRDGWEFASRTNASAVAVLVAVTDAGEIVLVEQYRIPVESNVIELPAGLAGDLDDPGEHILTAARRELIEETGFDAAAFTEVLTCPSSAGMSDETVTFVRASGLSRVAPGGGDGDEEITVHLVPLERVDRWICERQRLGTPVDPKIYTALYWLRCAQESADTA